MSMTSDEFAWRLRQTCPQVQAIVDAHIDEFGELLLHVLVADVRRFCIASFDEGTNDELGRCLAGMADGLETGDDAVENAVAVSFVEDSCWWDPEMAAFIATWPPALRAEAERQRTFHGRP